MYEGPEVSAGGGSGCRLVVSTGFCSGGKYGELRPKSKAGPCSAGCGVPRLKTPRGHDLDKTLRGSSQGVALSGLHFTKSWGRKWRSRGCGVDRVPETDHPLQGEAPEAQVWPW